MKIHNLLISLLLFISVFISSNTRAQNGFMQGYYVNLLGDTINAQIKIKKWDVNPKYLIVKVNDQKKKFAPTDINGFEVNSRIYRSFKLKVDVSNHLPGTLDIGDQFPKYKDDIVFAELIYNSEKCLFRYKDGGHKLHLYVANNGEDLIPLVYKEFLVWTYVLGKTTKRVVRNEEYKNQLYAFFSKCDGFHEKIDLTKYDQGQMYNLFTRYDQCLGNSN